MVRGHGVAGQLPGRLVRHTRSQASSGLRPVRAGTAQRRREPHAAPRR